MDPQGHAPSSPATLSELATEIVAPEPAPAPPVTELAPPLLELARLAEPPELPAPIVEPRRPYPGLVQALGIMALLMAVQFVVAAVVVGIDTVTKQRLIESAAVLGVINLISFTGICAWVGRRMGHPVRAMLSTAPAGGTFSVSHVLMMCWAVAGQLMCAVGFVYLVGGKDVEKSKYVERLNHVMGPDQAWWVVVPLLVIVAPFTEEVLFRGQFLRGFLARYSAPVAIGASAALFSLMHLNPVQIPATLMLGIFSGVLYERTRSVWPSIVAHMLNNAVPALAAFQAGRGRQVDAAKALDPTFGALLGLIAGGLAVWIVALLVLRRSLPAPSDGEATTVAEAPAAASGPYAGQF